MNKRLIIELVIILILIIGLNFLKTIDMQYGDTIPKIVYQQNYQFSKEIYNNIINSKHVSIYAAYPDNIKKYMFDYPTLYVIESAIRKNWEPYLKKNNEVIIILKIDNNGNKEYKFIGNTGPYSAANAARKAVLSPVFIGNNILLKEGSVELVYKFTVSEK